MIVKHFTKILYITGILTMLPLLQFFLPYTALQIQGLSIGSGGGILFVRHWGLMAFCFGALLVYAAVYPHMRRGVVIAAAVEKLGLVVMLAIVWNEPLFAGMRPVLVVDALCVWLYGIYLVSGQSSRDFAQVPERPAR